VLRALITLALGCAVYLSAALASRTKEDLHFSLRWLYAGMSLALLWGSLQALYIIHFNPAYFERISQIQSHISIRRLFHNRISGLTYEPNWFAEQITFLLLPWLLSSVLTGTSVFRWRWHRLTVESLLLVWSVALLPFTFSRAGLLNLFVLIAVGVLLLFIQHRRDRTSAPVRRVSWPRRVAVFGLTISALGGLIFFAGSRNEFFSRLWSYWGTGKEFNLSSYFSYLGFDARFTYSETAYNVYKAYPLFGVGLGNYAFYFREMMPETPLAYIPEVLRVITPGADRNLLITPKNFYLRLLAETGLVGTAAFFVFLIAVFGCTLYLWLSPRREERFWGAGGLLALVAFALSTFSFDSFAIPNMWVIFGLITAAAWVAAHSEQEEKDGLRQSGALPRPITASFAANLPPGEEVPHS
jgi:O-antigen ligase